MDSSVKSWYTIQYSSDGVGNRINSDVTFSDLNMLLSNHSEFCRALGVNDLIVRKRAFKKLADLYYNGNYDAVNNRWYWS